jgi:plasmid stabilization system protein ParE
MRVVWTTAGLNDLNRLYAFLVPKNETAAADVIQSLTAASRRLSDFPRLGPKLSEYEGREVRHIVVGEYDLRYEVLDDTILVLRVWHGRENR